MLKQILALNVLLWQFFVLYCHADTFEYRAGSRDIIGEVKYVTGQPGTTLAEIGRQYDIGHVEMIEANPDINPKYELEYAREVVIPSEFIIPPGAREGIVINLAELRLYYFHPDNKQVTTEPIGIGRDGWNTPLGTTKIVEKKKDPTWTPTANIRADAQANGIFIPKVVEAGDDNPMGRFALRLGWTEYLIHGTNKVEGIGRRSSAGCIRMYPEDIELLFSLVKIGTKVRVINTPVKFGWADGALFVEAHSPLHEDEMLYPDWSEIVDVLNSKYGKTALISWSTTQNALNYNFGYPIPIGEEST